MFHRQLVHSVVANILNIQKADAKKCFSTACSGSGKLTILFMFLDNSSRRIISFTLHKKINYQRRGDTIKSFIYCSWNGSAHLVIGVSKGYQGYEWRKAILCARLICSFLKCPVSLKAEVLNSKKRICRYDII